MKYDLILAGVGGQGVISVATIIAHAALSEGFEVRQSEVHGMAQRGGQVLSHMRFSDKEIPGDLVPKGGADMIIAMEPLEGLRYVPYLKPDGILVTAAESFVNMSGYPDIDSLHSTIKKLPKWRIIKTAELAKEAGLAKTANTVMIGAASCFLPIKSVCLEKIIADTFAKKETSVVTANAKAFKLGQAACKV
ncbi:MAG: indolepyruvate oxidoreductase subunit beta [Treponema sp.]|jgi:indolepyruvate ferredoxin oxidoreductase beta subunit|nr:indolepyruvate oxidoreductase subunit beta [Treponema sp.]